MTNSFVFLMGIKYIKFLIFSFLFVFNFLSLFGVTSVSSCQDITSSGEYVLVNDIDVEGGFCFENIVDNVIFDCQGFTIDGDNGNIFEGADVSGFEVKNCYIKNSDQTFKFDGVSDSKFINLTINNSHDRIFDMTFVNNNLIENINVNAERVWFNLVYNNELKNSNFILNDFELNFKNIF